MQFKKRPLGRFFIVLAGERSRYFLADGSALVQAPTDLTRVTEALVILTLLP